MRLLVIENDLDLLQTIIKGIKNNGHYVEYVTDGKKAINLISTEVYDLIILDLDLPIISGFDILNKIISKDKNAKVLVIIKNEATELKVKCLDLGASDCVVKPFCFKELEARIRALLRRNVIVTQPMLVFGDLMFNTVKRELYVKKELVILTKKETAIIEYLLLNQDRIVKVDELLIHAWNSYADYFGNSVRVHITTLRKKIKLLLGYNPIQNKVGEGYYLVKK
ncbi:DNA-binding response regulator, OmpR family, contains REC and winged-helix (wHTH) domain [Granulicatella balaenopterae]|uniref:DNA-binding response regulator, OmpR family, contains REC and winged-helix (WHTH) domain n=1 Tax=Granulicatella balaenopterae TaxID=137733 RepID=A0A1H9IAC2_9LACT|nr:response regulator transcription factor [Granulicatella balaenopterae]SEQ71523.1 DNA-binding response regulator, OmpR family, contains REC and winged-helix (wHTH) domain [Granulicatella balaenopterae]